MRFTATVKIQNTSAIGQILTIGLFFGCGEQPNETIGQLQLTLLGGDRHDVTQFRFDVVPTPGDCASGPIIASATVPLEDEHLPASLGLGDGHFFADGLFVLPPGRYAVCAAPLQADGSPSLECATASGADTVVAQQSTEVVLISQCVGPQDGGLDIVAALNDPPRIEDLAITPSKFIKLCESADIALTATDIDGDPLTIGWAVTMQPAGASPSVTTTGTTANFSTDIAGDYQITVTVTDAHAAQTSLSFPIYVQDLPCTGDACWLYGAGGTGSEQAFRIVVDDSQNSYASGSFQSPTIDFGSGLHTHAGGVFNDTFLVKLDPDGNAVWSRTFGGINVDAIQGVVLNVAQTELLVAGYFRGTVSFGCPNMLTSNGLADIFVAKLSADDGRCVWSRAFGGTGFDFGIDAAIDSSDDVVVTGYYNSPVITLGPPSIVLTNAGNYDNFVIKFSGVDGDPMWAVGVGGPGQERRGAGVAVNAADQIAIAGSFTSPSVSLPSSVPGATRVVMNNSSGTGTFVGLLNAGGLALQLIASTEGSATVPTIDFDSTGQLAIGGLFTGVLSFGDRQIGPSDPAEFAAFVTKFGPMLGHDWTMSDGGPVAAVTGLAFDTRDDVRIVGVSTGPIDFRGRTSVQGSFVGTLQGTDGSLDWLIGGTDAGTPLASIANDVALGPRDNTFVAGAFGPTAGANYTIGGAPSLGSTGGSDIWVAKIAP